LKTTDEGKKKLDTFTTVDINLVLDSFSRIISNEKKLNAELENLKEEKHALENEIKNEENY